MRCVQNALDAELQQYCCNFRAVCVCCNSNCSIRAIFVLRQSLFFLRHCRLRVIDLSHVSQSQLARLISQSQPSALPVVKRRCLPCSAVPYSLSFFRLAKSCAKYARSLAQHQPAGGRLTLRRVGVTVTHTVCGQSPPFRDPFAP